MDVIENPSLTDLDRPAGERAPICVLLPPDSGSKFGEVATWLGVDLELAEQLPLWAHRRPFAHVDGRQIVLVVFATEEVGRPTEVHLHVGEPGLLVVCPPAEFEFVRRAVARVVGTAENALVAVLLALARRSEEVIQDQAEVAATLDQAPAGLMAGVRRREVSRARSQLFALQRLWFAHQEVLGHDDQLVDALPDSARRVLRRARAIFASSSMFAAQLYELLGDTLNRHSTMVNERLTLIAVIFFPLTVSTGFFGMNFEWLTANITSFGAFLGFGILVPIGLVVVTAIGARWLGD